MGRPFSTALLAALVAASLLAGCGTPARSSTRPDELLGKPPAGLIYALPDAATVSQIVGILQQDTGNQLDARDVAVRIVRRQRRRVGAVVVLDGRGSGQEGVFKGFDREAEKAGVHPVDKTVAGTKVKQAELKGIVATVAVEHGFVLETIAADAASGELLLRPLVERAATVSD
jgi:hypothetical protein